MDEKSNISNESVDEEMNEEISAEEGKEGIDVEMEATAGLSKGSTESDSTVLEVVNSVAGQETAAAAETAAGMATEQLESSSLPHKPSPSSSSSQSPAVISRSSISSASRISTNRPQMQSTSSEVCHLFFRIRVLCGTDLNGCM